MGNSWGSSNAQVHVANDFTDRKIYVTNEKARTTVIATGPEFKILSENPLEDERTLSSIAVSGSQLFLRPSTALYCIGN